MAGLALEPLPRTQKQRALRAPTTCLLTSLGQHGAVPHGFFAVHYTVLLTLIPTGVACAGVALTL